MFQNKRIAKYTAIIELKEKFAKKVITYDYLNNFDTISGIDVSYKDRNTFCSAIIVDKNTLEIIEIEHEKSTIEYPYIPVAFYFKRRKTFTKNIKIIEKLL